MDKISKSGGPILANATAMQAHFFTLLSHDLRSTLSSIKGSLRMLEEAEGSDGADLQLQRAVAAAGHLEDLLNSAFDAVADPETLSGAPEETCNLGEELRQIANYWRGIASEKQARISFSVFNEAGDHVIASRLGLHRVLNNVLNNAIKYAAGGQVAVSCSKVAGDRVVIRVADSGPGFSDEALRRIFSFRGRPVNSARDGSGMGMYIAKYFVDAMHGEIKAGNGPDGGAVVEVFLPVVQVQANAGVEKSSILPDLSHLKILLAEDNKTNQMVVTQMLSTLGAQFSLASDGVEALRLFESEAFDLALLDIEMPRMSGLELIRHIRDHGDARAALPIAALTAYVMPEHRERILEAGAQAIIAKPIKGLAELGTEILALQRRSGNGPVVESAELGEIDTGIFEELRVTMGDETMAELAVKLAEDLDRVCRHLDSAAETLDINSIRSNSHVLVSIAGVIGAVNLQRRAEMLNAAAKKPEQEGLRELVLQCIAGIRLIQTFVQEKFRR